jgi:hypothetical protein
MLRTTKTTVSPLEVMYRRFRACSVIPIPCGLDEIEKNMKNFDLFGIKTHPIPLNPRGLRAKRTSSKGLFGYFQSIWIEGD